MNTIPRALVAFVLAGSLAGTGCHRTPRLDPGCHRGENVPTGIREAVERVARELYARIRADRWDEIYVEAADMARKGQDAGSFVAPMARASEALGLPEPERTVDIAAVRFGSTFLHDERVECLAAGADEPDLYSFPEHSLAVSLVQEAGLGEDRLLYASLWLWEDGAWRLGAFSVRRGTYLGADWRSFEEAAGEERRAGRNRNAALLYNIALDLVAPAPWIKPGAVETLRGKQHRISVSHLPVDRLDFWSAGPDTFRVFSMDAVMQPERPGILVQIEAVRDPADTTFQRGYGARLVEYIGRQFPEYAARFGSVTVRAVHPSNRDRAWTGTYPLPAATGP